MKLLLLVGAVLGALVVSGCKSTIDLDQGLEFPCSFDGGVGASTVAPCAAGFRCGRENRCHRLDAGAKYLCERDEDCEAEWRCGPDRRCADVAKERLFPADPKGVSLQRVFPTTREKLAAVAFSPYLPYATGLTCAPSTFGSSVSWAADEKIGKAVFPEDAVNSQGPPLRGIILADPPAASCLPDGGLRGEVRAELRAETPWLAPVQAMADLGRTVITVSPDGLLCSYGFSVRENALTGWCDGGVGFGPRELRTETEQRAVGVAHFAAFDESRIALGSILGEQLSPPRPLPGAVRVEDVTFINDFAFASSDAGMYLTRVPATAPTGFVHPADGGVEEPWMPLFARVNCPLQFGQMREAVASPNERFVLYRVLATGAFFEWNVGRLVVGAASPDAGAYLDAGLEACVEELGPERVVFFQDEIPAYCEKRQTSQPAPTTSVYTKPTAFFPARLKDNFPGLHLRCDQSDGGSVVNLAGIKDDRTDDPTLFVSNLTYLRTTATIGAQSSTGISFADPAGRIWVQSRPQVVFDPGGDGPVMMSSDRLSVGALDPDRRVSGVTGRSHELVVAAGKETVGGEELLRLQHWTVDKLGRWTAADPITNLLPLVDGVSNQPDWSLHVPPVGNDNGPDTSSDTHAVLVVLQRPRGTDVFAGGVQIAAVGELSGTSSSGAFATVTTSSDGGSYLLAGANDSLLAADVSAFVADAGLFRGLNPRDAQRAPRLEVRLTPVPRGRLQSIATVTALGQNLINGYLISSNRVFSFSAETPFVWKSEEQTVRGGTPLEVFVDRNRARVGFREGLVLALPSRVQLVPPLKDEQRPVVDYEVVCGQTFALAASGLFALRADGQTGVGEWVPVPGATPQVVPSAPGRLYRTVDAAGKPALFLFDSRGQSHQVVLPGECP